MFDDLMSTATYAKWKAYGRKLYFAVVQGKVRHRKPFKTATAALDWARRLEARYWKLKQAV